MLEEFLRQMFTEQFRLVCECGLWHRFAIKSDTFNTYFNQTFVKLMQATHVYRTKTDNTHIFFSILVAITAQQYAEQFFTLEIQHETSICD